MAVFLLPEMTSAGGHLRLAGTSRRIINHSNTTINHPNTISTITNLILLINFSTHPISQHQT